MRIVGLYFVLNRLPLEKTIVIWFSNQMSFLVHGENCTNMNRDWHSIFSDAKSSSVTGLQAYEKGMW